MAVHRANALAAVQAGIGFASRTEVNPDIMRAEFIASIDVDLVNI